MLSHPEKHKIRYLLFALSGEEWRIADAMEMNRNLCVGTVISHETDVRRMGELLGYLPQNIEQFVSRTFDSQPA
ncbi:MULTISPECIES: hypothetical protein [Thalassospira]|uniref:hypothetical protein n=1 Tax=Thalassospira TaxID=168934 RepID=UPI0011BF1780|nr:MULTISPECIES: hypothetical protein [Thalassospira]WOI09532.1 hypothetical protein R1T41_13425 [Thalassospira lucentensis]